MMELATRMPCGGILGPFLHKNERIYYEEVHRSVCDRCQCVKSERETRERMQTAAAVQERSDASRYAMGIDWGYQQEGLRQIRHDAELERLKQTIRERKAKLEAEAKVREKNEAIRAAFDRSMEKMKAVAERLDAKKTIKVFIPHQSCNCKSRWVEGAAHEDHCLYLVWQQRMKAEKGPSAVASAPERRRDTFVDLCSDWDLLPDAK